MASKSDYRHGTPAWVDLLTSDPEAARLSYGALFGWDIEVGPPEAEGYATCHLGGDAVAGIPGRPSEEGQPVGWTVYLASDDADATAKAITAAGGAVLLGPMAVMEEGRMLLATDPAGAMFGVWQAGQHIGATRVNEPGTVIWNELVTTDLGAAQHFYGQVFGYTGADVDTGRVPYRTLDVDGRPVAGVYEDPTGGPGGGEPRWITYFCVADTDAAAATVERHGGRVVQGPEDSAHGRWAAVADAQGARFCLLNPASR